MQEIAETKRNDIFHQHFRHERASCEEILCAISFAWLFCCFQFVVATDVLYVFRKLRKYKVINMSWSFYNWWLCFCCHVLSLPLCEIFIKPSRKDIAILFLNTRSYGPNKMLKWVVFSKPQEFRKRVVVSQFTFITFLLTYLEVTYCILRTPFFLTVIGGMPTKKLLFIWHMLLNF